MEAWKVQSNLDRTRIWWQTRWEVKKTVRVAWVVALHRQVQWTILQRLRTLMITQTFQWTTTFTWKIPSEKPLWAHKAAAAASRPRRATTNSRWVVGWFSQKPKPVRAVMQALARTSSSQVHLRHHLLVLLDLHLNDLVAKAQLRF